MLTFANKYKKNVFSQNGEDGIIEEILSRLSMNTGYVAEFGAADGIFFSNTRKLILNGFSAILIEGDPRSSKKMVRKYRRIDRVKVYPNTFVTEYNINNILPARLDLLSIDVDGIDYFLWASYCGDAKIVVIEINSGFHPLSDVKGLAEQGSSYKSMLELALLKGYFLVCHTGNCIFLKKEYRHLFPEITGDPIGNIKDYFNQEWLKEKL